MLIETIISSITIITVSSLIFARSLIAKEDKNGCGRKILDINNYGSMDICPICNSGRKKEIYFPIKVGPASYLKNKKDDGKCLSDRQSHQDCTGPSSAMVMSFKGELRLYQICYTCYGEWYNLPHNKMTAILSDALDKDDEEDF